MSGFDPTTNRISFGLLTSAEQAALKSWPHGFEFYQLQEWCDCPIPFWSPRAVYRGKPAPVITRVYYNIHANDSLFRYSSRHGALYAARATAAIGTIYIEIVDGEIEDVGKVKRDEK